MHQFIASASTALAVAAVVKCVLPSSPSPAPANNNSNKAPVPILPLELVDPLLAMAIRLCTSKNAEAAGSSLHVKQVLNVISRSSSPSSLTLQAALLHGLPWFTVGHATGTRRRVIDRGSSDDGRDSSSTAVRVSLLNAHARPYARAAASSARLIPMSFRPSDLILPATSTLADQLAVCDWWTQHLPLPTMGHLAPLVLVSPHAKHLTRYLLSAHATLGTQFADTDMDATLTLLASLKCADLCAWYRHEYTGPLKSLASATSVLYPGDSAALVLAHELATPPRVASHAILDACALGNVQALTHYVSLGCILEPSTRAMDVASDAGHVEVLKWWVKQGLDIKYSDEAVDFASKNGHVDVLAWWWARRGEWPMEYTNASVDLASSHGQINVLQWWKDKHPKYSEAAVHGAAMAGHLRVLAWWADESSFGLPIKVDPRSLAALLSGKRDGSGVHVLEWWEQRSGLPSLVEAVDVRILETCATRRAVDYWMSKLNLVGLGFGGLGSKWVRQWVWPKVTFTLPATVDQSMIDWWADESGLAFVPSTDLITDLCVQGDLSALKWWSQRGPLPALRGQDAFKVMHAGRVDVLAWFAAHGGEIVVQDLDPRVVDWVVTRYYGGKARMSTQWDGMVEAVDAYGMSGKDQGVRLVG
ncbi:hypothetical protein BCR44DRAFT_1438285 [Catenaria anguillulae PL171]|uniref:Ankyrin repeat-containing domain protein n=1 Tax=Catenaria anguillulae PL171 TaxID=765915 RepID=A0A1Y2HJS5_9FUNG|nr:hypothetical protein BCR44DRAFT_1438285 [Catenaria anguillulae PL171]